jgi:hypothetical protein
MTPFSKTNMPPLLKEDNLETRKDGGETEQFAETSTSPLQRQIVRASEYSAHVQEAMRYDRLGSSEYPLVMTILDAVLEGYAEKDWEERQSRTLKELRQQQPQKGVAHSSEANRYEQIVSCLKDLSLWPW